jgi:hypothetical protein
MKGDRIRLNVRTMGGWKGTGTIILDDGEGVVFIKDGSVDNNASRCHATRKEVTKIRKGAVQ